jgi:hypothetical protein
LRGGAVIGNSNPCEFYAREFRSRIVHGNLELLTCASFECDEQTIMLKLSTTMASVVCHVVSAVVLVIVSLDTIGVRPIQADTGADTSIKGGLKVCGILTREPQRVRMRASAKCNAENEG